MMTDAARLIATNPTAPTVEAGALAACIEACFDCAQACTACADACLGEEDVAGLRRCIRTDLDCADLCAAAGAILTRQTTPDRAILRATLTACKEACRVCGDECDGHTQHGMEHCRICVEACRRCEQACNTLLQSLPA